MKSILSLILMCCWLSGNGYAQQPQQPSLSPDEHREILKALIDRDAAVAKVRELTSQLVNADEAGRLLQERVQAERAIRLAEKRLYLDSLLSLKEYRTRRRPLFIKVVTLGVVRDRKDAALEAQITGVQAEIMTWK